MAAISKHEGDILDWLKKVINSCTELSHVASTRNLLRNFNILYPEVPYRAILALRYKLDVKFYDLIEERQQRINNILK